MKSIQRARVVVVTDSRYGLFSCGAVASDGRGAGCRGPLFGGRRGAAAKVAKSMFVSWRSTIVFRIPYRSLKAMHRGAVMACPR